MLGCVFGLRLRQSEGLMVSLLDLLGLDLPVPDHTTLSRRAQTWVPRLSRQRHPEDRPLHVLVDSTGLKVFGAWKTGTARDHGVLGTSCIWPWRLITARSSPTG
jgi:Transposase DDE domain